MWYIATSASVASGEDVVEVLAGDDVSSISSGSALIFEDGSPVEVLEAYETTEGSFIKLASNWPYTTKSAQPLLVYPTSSGLAEATAALKLYLDNIQVASTIEAQTGTNDTKIMTALKTKQSIDFNTGTAAAADVTTSNTDTTAGRVMTVGWGGIGGVRAAKSSYGNDLNNLIDNYGYNGMTLEVAVDTQNRPDSIAGAVVKLQDTYILGASFPSTKAGEMYSGVKSSGGDSIDWNTLYHSGNTNFNEFTFDSGKGINGFARNTGEVHFPLYLNSPITPSGISVIGTFSIINLNTGVVVESGLTASAVPSGLGGKVSFFRLLPTVQVTRGVNYLAYADSGGVTITVNF